MKVLLLCATERLFVPESLIRKLIALPELWLFTFIFFDGKVFVLSTTFAIDLPLC